MTDIVFARTRYVYDSYTDFWKLVELSEYPVVYVDEIDVKDRAKTYIAAPFNGEFFPLGEVKRKCKIFLWNLERPLGSGGAEQYKEHLTKHISNGYIDDVIVSDVALAKITGYKYVPVGSHKDLGSPGSDKKYDYIHLMCYSNRRGILFDEPTKPKTSFSGRSIALNGWGEARHKSLQESRFMLNVHQDTDMIMEPLRFALAAAYELPILTENLYENSYPYIVGITHFPIGDIASAMLMAVRRYGVLLLGAKELRKLVTGPYSFRRCIKRYL